MQKSYGFIIIGFFSGFISSLLGVGGGIIMVPALLFFYKYKIKKAIGTSLAVIAPSTFVGIITKIFLDIDCINFLFVFAIIIGSIFGAKIGTIFINFINEKILRNLFVILLVLASLKLINIINFSVNSSLDFSMDLDFFAFLALIFLGFISGIASALLGIGGGIIMVPILNLFFGLSVYKSTAISLAVIVPTAIMGAYFHNKMNNIIKKDLKKLVLASLFGAILGAKIATVLDTETLKFIFGVFVFVCAIKIFFENFSFRKKLKKY